MGQTGSWRSNREVRFTPESRLNSNIGPCLKSAKL